MPYIDKPGREIFEPALAELRKVAPWPDNAGELNYLFTQIARIYLDNHGLRYQRINDIVGALEGAKLELYRRVAASYEDGKIKENGDVYEDR